MKNIINIKLGNLKKKWFNFQNLAEYLNCLHKLFVLSFYQSLLKVTHFSFYFLLLVFLKNVHCFI